MANRAYLFSKDKPNAERPLSDWEPYYDSRHIIPFAWWFLFEPSDIKLVDIVSDGRFFEVAQWQEVRFIANRNDALKRFSGRQRFLLDITGNKFDTSCIQRFYERLCKRPGEYLLMNPDEILQDDGDKDALHCTRILEAIGSTQPSEREIKIAIWGQPDLEFKSNDDFEVRAVGITYWP